LKKNEEMKKSLSVASSTATVRVAAVAATAAGVGVGGVDVGGRRVTTGCKLLISKLKKRRKKHTKRIETRRVSILLLP
jgi:hypothetical protein